VVLEKLCIYVRRDDAEGARREGKIEEKKTFCPEPPNNDLWLLCSRAQCVEWVFVECLSLLWQMNTK
jgi:hypothetical protein